MQVEVSGLCKSFYRQTVLNKVSFTILSGSVVCLLGPNGSGKTTLLKILSSIASIGSGKVSINGKEIFPGDPSSRKFSLYIGHNASLYPSLSALENLFFISGLYGLDASVDKIDEHLRFLSLDNHRDKQIKFYSQGMLQRLKLAVADLIPSPVLYLDEPLNALDQEGANLFNDLIIEWKKVKRTMLIATHNIDWVLGIADRIITLKNGQIDLDLDLKVMSKEDAGNLITGSG